MWVVPAIVSAAPCEIWTKPCSRSSPPNLPRFVQTCWSSKSALLQRPLALHEAHRRSARNLAHYLALRRHDIRKLQAQLAQIGLSSLGRTESHVLNAVRTVDRVLNVLLGSDSSLRVIRRARGRD